MKSFRLVADAPVRAAIHRYGLTWPIATDNGLQTWNAYGNRFWPALYLIDRNGRVVYRHVGEGNYEETDQRIRQVRYRFCCSPSPAGWLPPAPEGCCYSPSPAGWLPPTLGKA